MELVHALYEPDGEGPHATIIALHGRGANALDLLGLAPYVCGGRLLVICPQGPVEMAIGPGALGYAWFPPNTGGAPDVAAIVLARNELEKFLDACLARYPIDRRKLAVVGFSQGGVMAYSLGLKTPGRFAAVAALSSWLPKELVESGGLSLDLQQLPVLVQHGTRDELIAVDRARESVEILRDLRVPVTYREYDMGHEINQRSLTELSQWLEEKLFSSIVLAR
jgi:phospholipase/carboxylesterase